jgi:hypothetical protein
MSFIASVFSKSNARKYSLVVDEDGVLDSESLSFLQEKERMHTKSSSTRRFVAPWILSTVVFAALSLYFYLKTLTPSLGAYEKGWKTDFRTLYQPREL